MGDAAVADGSCGSVHIVVVIDEPSAVLLYVIGFELSPSSLGDPGKFFVDANNNLFYVYAAE